MSPTWVDIAKLAVSALTPVVVAVLGVLLLRRIEGVKAAVTQNAEFEKKWADQFFEACQEFMQTLERDLALLTVLAGLADSNQKIASKLMEEIAQLHPKLSELELRIRRCVVFAPKVGASVASAAAECIALAGALISSGSGNVDIIISKMNEFNLASQEAHGEMLGIGFTKT